MLVSGLRPTDPPAATSATRALAPWVKAVAMTRSACASSLISWRRRWTRCVHFQLGTEHRSNRCGGGRVPPRELTYPTERLGVQSAWTVLARENRAKALESADASQVPVCA